MQLIILHHSFGIGNMDIDVNDRVQYIGCSPEQINWGNNDDPSGLLEEGYVYHVSHVDIRSSHTKIMLKGIPGKFNSVCFQKVT